MKSAVQTTLVSLLVLFCYAVVTDARLGPVESFFTGLLPRRFLFLVDTPAATLDYHNGPVLTGTNGVIPINIIWYGSFSATDKSAVHDFLASFQGESGEATDVTKWWSVTGGFKDATGGAVAGSLKLAGELDDAYSLGKNLKDADIQSLVLNSLSTFQSNTEAMYFVLTASDVIVEDFCMSSCASHSATGPSTTTGGLQLPYAWVGNAKDQCPGMCAWPFAQPSYMPANADLPLPPNLDVGTDGVIIQMAYMLAGTASNPFDNAYYQGDASIPLEAGTACTGFGVGAYPGYPGELKKDVITGGAFNAEGVNGRKFLLPTLWDPSKRACTPIALLQ